MNKVQFLKNFCKVLKIKFILTLRALVLQFLTTASTFISEIQKHLETLRKQQKSETRTYFQLYSSDPIPPRLYGFIKAHKPERFYAMRAIVSIVGTLPCGISQYLVELIQPTLTKSKHKTTNLLSFVNEAKNWLTKVSYDIINLYPSVSINKALDVLIDQLNNDKDDLMKRTKLCSKDIYELAKIYLSKCYFLWNNEIRISKNSSLLDYLLWLFYSKVTFRIWNTKPLQEH